MGFFRCSRGHGFAILGREHTQSDIDGQCPDCHRDDTLLYLNLTAASFLANTFMTDELFEDGAPLHPLYQQVLATKAHEQAALCYDFELRQAPTRQGIVLAYLAQALLSEGLNASRDEIQHHGYRPELVVVVGLAVVSGEAKFYIGVNGHDNIYEPAVHFVNAMPATICGYRCERVFEKEPHLGAYKRLSNSVSAWSWHGEQKVIKTIKEEGIEARLTITCLGIGHRLGPCSHETAGDGSNGCYHYLANKFERDEARVKIGENATVTVSAYWYAHPIRARNINLASISI